MTDTLINEILIKAIKKMAKQEQQANDESWKKEAGLAIEERINAFNKLELFCSTQQHKLN